MPTATPNKHRQKNRREPPARGRTPSAPAGEPAKRHKTQGKELKGLALDMHDRLEDPAAYSMTPDEILESLRRIRE